MKNPYTGELADIRVCGTVDKKRVGLCTKEAEALEKVVNPKDQYEIIVRNNFVSGRLCFML